MTRYRHTQVGWVMGGAAAGVVVLFVATNRALPGAATWALAGAAVLLALFGTLTVTVDETRLRARFGIGLIGTSLPLSEVRGVAAVSNPWWWGWGIRLFPGGVLYNVSGLSAVELVLSDGRRRRIGTDEPAELLAALRALVREGEVPAPSSWSSRRWPAGVPGILAGLLAAALVVGLAAMVTVLLMEPRPIEARLAGGALEVESFVYDTRVSLGDVTAVALEPELPVLLRRTNGFSAAGTHHGHYEVQGLGRGMVFVDRCTAPFLVVRTARTFVIVGFEDAARTNQLHAELQGALTAR